MSIQDFVSIPLGKYIQNNLDFGANVDSAPLIFGVNYFLRDATGKFVNGIRDKHVWLKWMELRVHGDCQALRGPTGLIPKYDDLKALFRENLDKDYAVEEYVEQFTVRTPELLAKIGRIERIYAGEEGCEKILSLLAAQKKRIEKARKEKGDYISPLDL